jgi:hypothetical protein
MSSNELLLLGFLIFLHFALGCFLAMFFIRLLEDTCTYYNSTLMKILAFSLVFLGIGGVVVILFTFIVFGLIEVFNKINSL